LQEQHKYEEITSINRDGDKSGRKRENKKRVALNLIEDKRKYKLIASRLMCQNFRQQNLITYKLTKDFRGFLQSVHTNTKSISATKEFFHVFLIS